MDKLWLLFPSAFWKEELETDWINYISDKPGEWLQCLNVYKYLKVPVLLLFNIGDAAATFSGLPDDQVVASAMQAIRTWCPGAPDPVSFRRSNWGADPYSMGSWAYIAAGSTPEDCDSYAEADTTGYKVFFAGEGTISNMIGTVHGAWVTGSASAKDAINSIKEGSA